MAKKRAFVRYTKTGKIVPGSLVVTNGSYPEGPAKWSEVAADLCCDIPCNCDGNYNWKLLSKYSPAEKAGEITFPNHIAGTWNTNPNLIVLPGYALYINFSDLNGNATGGLFNLLVGNSGILTLKQGNNSVVYTFTNEAFYFDLIGVYYDSTFGSSTEGSLQILTSSIENFNTNQCINIFIQST
jgi:hypothetical protein